MELGLTGQKPTILQSNNFLGDFGANFPLMIMEPMERLTIDASLGLDIRPDSQLVQLDSVGYFFAVVKKKPSSVSSKRVVEKLVFGGERPKDNFARREMLFDGGSARFNEECEVTYSLQADEEELVWSVQCMDGDELSSLKIYEFSLHSMKRRTVLEISQQWNQAVIAEIVAGKAHAELLIESAGFLQKV